MFTFEDLTKLDPGSVQTLMRHVDKDTLGRALKGATERCALLHRQHVDPRGEEGAATRWPRWDRCGSRTSTKPQTKMVKLAKDLAEKGEIMITKNRANEELVY